MTDSLLGTTARCEDCGRMGTIGTELWQVEFSARPVAPVLDSWSRTVIVCISTADCNRRWLQGEERTEAPGMTGMELYREHKLQPPDDLDTATYDGQGHFVGHEPNEDCAHRTVGEHRAWCHDCLEWCYPHMPCVRCDRAIKEGRATGER